MHTRVLSLALVSMLLASSCGDTGAPSASNAASRPSAPPPRAFTPPPPPPPPPVPEISSFELVGILRGCCIGAGGTNIMSYRSCLLFEDKNVSAFVGCVGEYNVRFDGPGQSGEVRRVSGEQFVRAL